MNERVLVQSAADATFQALATRYLQEFARFAPVDATRIGDHRYDTQLDDLSATGRDARSRWARELLSVANGLERASLSRDNQVDALLLTHALRFDIWSLVEARQWEWDPLLYNDLAGSAIYNLMARDFAPVAERLWSAALRLECLGGIYASARANLVVERVPLIHAEQACDRNPGVAALIDELIVPRERELPRHNQSRLTSAIGVAKKAIAEHQRWLETELIPNARGNFRIGAGLFDAWLEFALHSKLSRGAIAAHARQTIAEVRAEMYGIASRVLGDSVVAPASPTREQQQSVIQAALALSAEERPTRDAQVAFAERALRQAIDFVRTRRLATLPTDPVEIVLMPRYKRGLYVGACDPPGPLDLGQKTFYEISPIPEEWDADAATSFQREYNARVIEIYTFHEAVPGHYLQFAIANRHPSKLRAIFWSNTFVEGWATYAQRMMTETGWRAGDLLMQLEDRKIYLRACANALIDQGLHVDGMTREEAMHLMIHDTFQEEREAAGKYQRAQLAPTQLSTYLVGLGELIDLRREAEARWGEKFSLKEFHDRILEHGAPPVKCVRAQMFGLSIDAE